MPIRLSHDTLGRAREVHRTNPRKETSMSTSNLSAAANETLQSCGQTAEALIGACRSGGNRVIGRVDDVPFAFEHQFYAFGCGAIVFYQ